MKKVRIGLIGAGQVAWGNAREIAKHPQAELIAVADPSAKRAKKLQKEVGMPRSYLSAKELLADADIDAVSISVPNALHAPIAIAAFRAGKHVLLDKPFTVNSREAEAVIDASKKARKVFTVGMNQRFTEGAQTIKALVERGELGEIYHAKAYWLRRSGVPKLGTWFCVKKAAGGGVLMDIGVHMLDLCLYLMGNFKPVSVFATTKTAFGHRGLGEGSWGHSERGKRVFDVEDFASGMIRLKGGATLSLEVSWALHQERGSHHDVELFGTDAGAAVFPAKLFKFGKKKGEYEVIEPQGVKGPLLGENRYTNWIDVILKKAPPCCTPKEALAVQKTLDALYTSARTRKEVRID